MLRGICTRSLGLGRPRRSPPSRRTIIAKAGSGAVSSLDDQMPVTVGELKTAVGELRTELRTAVGALDKGLDNLTKNVAYTPLLIENAVLKAEVDVKIKELDFKLSKAQSDLEVKLTKALSDLSVQLTKAQLDVSVQLTGLEGKMTTALTGLEGKMTTALTGLEGKMTTAQSGIENMTTELSEIKKKLTGLEVQGIKAIAAVFVFQILLVASSDSAVGRLAGQMMSLAMKTPGP